MEEISEPGGAAGGSIHRKAIVRLGRFRYSAVEFLVALVLLFLVTPFVEDLVYGDLIEALLVTLVMAFGVLAVGERRRTLILALLLVTPALAAKWAHHIRPDLVPPEAFLAAGMVFFAFVFVHLLRFILRAPRVDTNVLCAGISGYLMLGLLWVPAYLLVASAASPERPAFFFSVPPGASHVMTGFNAFYFSFTSLTTLGYGDITPVSNVARTLAMLEAMCGTLFVGVLIARLVSLYSTPGPPAEQPRPPGGT
jgi:hypothetical protein